MRSIMFDVLEINIVMTLVILLLCLFAGEIRKKYGAMWLKVMWIVLMVRLLLPYNFSLPVTDFRLFNEPGFEQEMTRNEGSNVLNDNAENIQANLQGANDEITQENLGNTTIEMNTEQPQEGMPMTPVDDNKENTNDIVTDIKDAEADRRETTVFRYTDILLWVWMIGIYVSAIYHLAVYVMLRQKLIKGLKPLKNATLQEQIESLQKQYLGKVKLTAYESNKVQSPVLTGFVYPKLIIPSRNGEWVREELELVIAHELCHYQMKDLWLKMFMLIVTCINWFNPAVYMMKKQFYYDMELVCDSCVIRDRSDEEKEIYARILMDFAGKNGRNYTFMTGLAGGKKLIKNRIYHIWDTSNTKNGIWMFVCITMSVLCIGMFISCGYKPEEERVIVKNWSDANAGGGEQLIVETVTPENTPPVVNIQDYYSTNIGNPGNLYHIDENKVLWGCGRNNCGQLGQGTQDYDFHEEPVKIAENVVHVDFSQHDFAIYLTEDGNLYGMGTAGTGVMQEYEEITENMLMNEEHYFVSEPKLLMEDVIYASCGRDDIVCLLEDGSVWIWGTIWWEGVRGDSYVVVKPAKILENAVMVTGGMFNHAALLEDGSVWTWGYNYAGSCGVEGTKYVSDPVKVAEDVLMVWTGRTEYNSEITNIADFGGEYEYLPENTIILKEDGSYQACGVGLGEERYLDRFWEVNGFRIACSYEFVPIQSMADVQKNIFLVEDSNNE